MKYTVQKVQDEKNNKKIPLIYFVLVCFYSTIAFNPDFRGVAGLWYGINGVVLLFSLFFIIKEGKSIVTNYLLWFLTFFLFCFFSTLWAIDFSAGLDSIKTLSLLLLTLGSISIVIDTKETLYKILWGFFIACVLNALYILLTIDLLSISAIGQRIGAENLGEIWNANAIGFFVSAGGLLSIFLLSKKNKMIINIFCILAFAIFTLIVLFTGSRTAIVLFAMLIGVYSFLFARKHRFAMLIGIILIGLLSFYIIMNNAILYDVIGDRLENMLSGFLGSGTNEGSFNERQNMIDVGWQYFSQNPLFGYGTNNYQILYVAEKTGRLTYSHNNFIEMLVNLGIVGFILYYSGYLYILLNTIKPALKKDKLSILAFTFTLCYLITHWGTVSYASSLDNFLLLIGFMAVKINRKQENKVAANEQNYKILKNKGRRFITIS